MSFVDAEVLKDVVGAQAAGPAGFGINYEVENGAHIDSGGGAVEVKLNEQSLARAREQNNADADLRGHQKSPQPGMNDRPGLLSHQPGYIWLL